MTTIHEATHEAMRLQLAEALQADRSLSWPDLLALVMREHGLFAAMSKPLVAPGDDPAEIPGVIRLDEATFDALQRRLEEPAPPNEALKQLLAESAGVFSDLCDGDDPRLHAETDPQVRLHSPMRKADPDLARQAAEATRAVLTQKDKKDEFEAWVRARFQTIEERIDRMEQDIHEVKLDARKLTSEVEQKTNLLGEQLGQVGEWALRGSR